MGLRFLQLVIKTSNLGLDYSFDRLMRKRRDHRSEPSTEAGNSGAYSGTREESGLPGTLALKVSLLPHAGLQDPFWRSLMALLFPPACLWEAGYSTCNLTKISLEGRSRYGALVVFH